MSLADFIDNNEEKDGIRYAWNVWPNTKGDAKSLIIPISCVFTPLKERTDLQPLHYDPIHCTRQTCRAILNPFCQIDIQANLWVCPFCLQRNTFPPQYKGISPQQLPAELMQRFSTIEYTLQRGAVTNNPVFLFVVDTCMNEEDLNALKETLILGLLLLPDNAIVGIITFGRVVQVHELASEECAKSYVFRGDKETDAKRLKQVLGLSGNQQRPASQQGQGAFGAARFLQSLNDCEPTISAILEELQRDPWPVQPDFRDRRCTGAAIAIATSLMEGTYPNTGGRIMVFAGGACTEGPGMIVSPSYSEHIRTFYDFKKDSLKHERKASKFYTQLGERCAAASHCVDIFTANFEQTGMYEMKNLCNFTGGNLIIADSFDTALFKQTLQRVLGKDQTTDQYNMAFNATVDVKVSRELKVCGMLGCGRSAKKADTTVSETQIGSGGTNQWKMCSLHSGSSYAFFFEIANQQGGPLQAGARGLMQFITTYQHASGQRKVRVTTAARNFVATSGMNYIAQGFDQEAATAIMARMAVHRAESEEHADVQRWLDSKLIKICSKFGNKHGQENFLPDNFDLYPQFVFHLRRSQLLQVFNNSPDESAYHRNKLMIANVENSLIMIQPTLMSYTFGAEPRAVLLDSSSIQPNVILLLDSYSHILIWHGKNIAQWREEGYQDRPEHTAFKSLLEAPRLEAQELLGSRFPVPRFIDCDEGGSQARFLLAKVNPSRPDHGGYGQQGQEDPTVFTDDVNLQLFLDHLKKLASRTE